jgi:hypothetical protein
VGVPAALHPVGPGPELSQRRPDPGAALRRLDPLVGKWGVEVFLDSESPAGTPAQVVFEWVLDGRFLQQRSEVEHPEAPNSVSIISVASDHETYTQHYFDSRGVVRLYAMTFAEGEWTLLRDAPDFTPLSFSQRFTGSFSDDGDTIRARWETSRDGLSWERDFDLTYTRIG